MDILYMVLPCYNEQEVLRETALRLKNKLYVLIENNIISGDSKILFVNDGSKDKTWDIIQNLYEEDDIFAGLNLSRNKGHQNALFAGLMLAKDMADIAISIDADLQDDIEAIDDMLDAYLLQGYDIVYGVRSSRKKDSFFKRKTAEGFYRFMAALGVDIIFNHADYRLMNKKTLQSLSEFNEVNLFLRGLLPMIGYKYTTVAYERNERFAGETKYPLKKMLAFAIEGITSLSVRPIRIITVIGFISFIISCAMLVYFVIDYILDGTVAGWASTVVSIWAIGGLQLLAIGIIGEYIGKIYLEVKARPRYIVKEVLLHKNKCD